MAQNPNRVASLFKTKRDGLLVGTIEPGEAFDKLAEVAGEAQAKGKGVTLFVWLNDPNGKGPVAGVTIGVAQDREERPARKPIGNTAPPQTNNPLDALMGGRPANADQAPPQKRRAW